MKKKSTNILLLIFKIFRSTLIWLLFVQNAIPWEERGYIRFHKVSDPKLVLDRQTVFAILCQSFSKLVPILRKNETAVYFAFALLLTLINAAGSQVFHKFLSILSEGKYNIWLVGIFFIFNNLSHQENRIFPNTNVLKQMRIV